MEWQPPSGADLPRGTTGCARRGRFHRMAQPRDGDHLCLESLPTPRIPDPLERVSSAIGLDDVDHLEDVSLASLLERANHLPPPAIDLSHDSSPRASRTTEGSQPLTGQATAVTRQTSVVARMSARLVRPFRGKRGRPRRQLGKLHAEKAYDFRRCRHAAERVEARHRSLLGAP